MRLFIKCFTRDEDGSWRCIAPASWEGPPRVQVTPGTRFSPGSTFMGVDLAKLLEAQYQSDQRRR